MPNSMTAFARASVQTTWAEVTCELRSVNHRFLEMNFRLSDEIRHLEPRIREIITKSVNRGRIDCNIRCSFHDAMSSDIRVNQDLVDKLFLVADQIKAQNKHIEPLRIADVLRWPGVVQDLEVDADTISGAALSVLDTAVFELVGTRQREGARLISTLDSRLNTAAELVNDVKVDLPTWAQAFRERLEERLSKVKEELDPIRLEQEIVIYIQKSDVSEEVDRLQVHLTEVGDVLKQQKPVGRRLDFLMQELNREANTLGAKSVDTRLTQAAVELKVLIEQMREQVQNIE